MLKGNDSVLNLWSNIKLRSYLFKHEHSVHGIQVEIWFRRVVHEASKVGAKEKKEGNEKVVSDSGSKSSVWQDEPDLSLEVSNSET